MKSILKNHAEIIKRFEEEYYCDDHPLNEVKFVAVGNDLDLKNPCCEKFRKQTLKEITNEIDGHPELNPPLGKITKAANVSRTRRPS
jgi:hypothetical protein